MPWWVKSTTFPAIWYLASRVLSMATHRVSSDWETHFGNPLVAETELRYIAIDGKTLKGAAQRNERGEKKGRCIWPAR